MLSFSYKLSEYNSVLVMCRSDVFLLWRQGEARGLVVLKEDCSGVSSIKQVWTCTKGKSGRFTGPSTASPRKLNAVVSAEEQNELENESFT